MKLLDFYTNPHMLHTFSVHFPVALGALGMLLVLAGILTKMKSPTLRWMTFALYMFMGLAAFAAVVTGEGALAALPGKVPEDMGPVVDMHQWLAELLWIFASATALCLVFCAVKTEWFRATFAMLALLLSIVTAGWAMATSLYGMSLVHDYGAGTSVFSLKAAGNNSPPTVQTPEKSAKDAGSLLLSPMPSAPAGTAPDGVTPLEPIKTTTATPARKSYTSRVASFFQNIKDGLSPSR